jgi:hypothetical protein
LQRQATVIAALTHLNESLGVNLDPFIEFLTNAAADTAQSIISTNAQITKVQSLADKFRVCVPKPVFVPETHGFFRDRFAVDPLKCNRKFLPIDPDKEPN